MLFDKYFPVVFVAGGSIPKTDDRMVTELLQSHGMVGQCSVVGTACRNFPESHQIFTFHGISQFKGSGYDGEIQTTIRQGFQNLRRCIVLNTDFNIRVSALKIMQVPKQE